MVGLWYTEFDGPTDLFCFEYQNLSLISDRLFGKNDFGVWHQLASTGLGNRGQLSLLASLNDPRLSPEGHGCLFAGYDVDNLPQERTLKGLSHLCPASQTRQSCKS